MFGVDYAWRVGMAWSVPVELSRSKLNLKFIPDPERSDASCVRRSLFDAGLRGSDFPHFESARARFGPTSPHRPRLDPSLPAD
jgi:hypothetical protein